MTIPAPALEQFTKQVLAAVGETEYEYEDVDGIDRYRSVTFVDQVLADTLPKAIQAMADPRISSTTEDGERVTVTVVGDSAADFRDEFELEDALDALQEQVEEVHSSEPAEEEKPTRKRAAKRS